MSEDHALEVTIRKTQGKGAARTLRRSKLIPGIVYGGGQDNVMLTIDPNELRKSTDHQKEWNTVYKLVMKDDGQPDLEQHCVVTDIQRDSVRRDVIHVDFLRIELDKEITRKVPIEFVGRSAGVVKGGKMRTFRRLARVSAKPKEMPIKVTVDVTNVDGGQGLKFGDVPLENARFVEDPKASLCFVVMPKVKKVEEEDPKKKKKK